jgi:aryl-alcohol dehydrogenase-like predicted oxidoreductase
LTRDLEKEIIPVCRELGITLVPFSPLSRGLVTNTLEKDKLADNDYRRSIPRLSDEHWDNNAKLTAAFADYAKAKNCTPAQLALAWVLAQGEDIIPIPGTKKRKYLEENAGSVDITLSEKDLAAIDDLLKQYPNVGERYNDAALRLVNH